MSMIPTTGDWCRHVTSGNDYAVVLIAIDEKSLQERVIYQAFLPGRGRHGAIWDRPLSEFIDGRFMRMGRYDG